MKVYTYDSSAGLEKYIFNSMSVCKTAKNSSQFCLDIENLYRWTSHGDYWPRMCVYFDSQTKL